MVQHEQVFMKRHFPAVTLCPEVRFVDEKIDAFLDEIKYPPNMNSTSTREIINQLAAFYSLDVVYNLGDLLRLEELLEYNDLDVETAAERLTATCEETLIKCRFGNVLLNCSDIFQMELTGDGFCCIFNGRSLRREMEEGVKIKRTPQHWYTREFGYTSGLTIAVNQSQKPTSIDLTYKWIALQTSQHFVDTTMNGTALNPGAEQWISYSSIGFQIAMGAKTLSPSLRKCNMSTNVLRYFPHYSKNYCLQEKEMANTLNKCGCVRTPHPRPPGTTRCRAPMLLCATQAMISYDTSADCPLTCDVENIIVTASSFTLDPTVRTVESFYNGLNFKKVTVVRIFIQGRKRKTKERWSYFGYYDLFSQLGGMFNVCFGCSVLTMLELLQIGWRFMLIRIQRYLDNRHIRHVKHPQKK
ncbi:sodium channel protein Nach [Helicoverpa armigera]|uniref:sodium channel protein Nach n=1 Tax=Helicoverpa armigera TaxID=29058 RepID=UPI003083ED39